MTADRKNEAREKFLLGGIVVRAGLSSADRAFLLGGLLELARLSPETSEYRRLHNIGALAFRVPVSVGAYHTVTDAAE
ncbi:conjugal transfer protein TraD [Ochrobactrum sp. Kaboul]|nr:conjugal transfer protein TraD [Ochrobactrum sp. Kaboul]